MSHMQRKKKARKQRQLWGTGAGEIPCGFGLFSWQQTAAVLLLGSPCICFLQLSCLRMEPRFRLYALDILSEKDFHSLIPRGLQFHKGGSCVGKEGSWWLLLPGPHRTRSEGSYLLLSESFFLPLPCLASPIALVQSCSPVIQHSSLPISYFHFFFFLMMTGYLLGRALQAEAAWKSISFLGYETVKLNKSFISQLFTSNGNSKHPPPGTAFSWLNWGLSLISSFCVSGIRDMT